MRCAAFNTGPDFHLLDHIAPLTELMQMPLFTTEELNHQLARRYYPQVEVHHKPDLELQLGEIAEQFDVLFECKYWQPQLKAIFRRLYNKEMTLVFCQHGQSDKGFRAPLLAPYAMQDAVLIYGKLQIQMLKELGVWPSIQAHAVVGNYRLEFYRKYQSFYDGLIGKELPIDKKKRTLLYAPTWRDADQASSFFEHGAKVISELPADWNLLIKLHPLLEQRDPAQFYSLAALADRKPNAFLIHECPPVYPILALADAYLGDASSVGYDFLYFQKPLYFLPTAHPGKLHSCGQILDPDKNLYLQMERGVIGKNDLYREAFGSIQKNVRNRILKACGYRMENYPPPATIIRSS